METLRALVASTRDADGPAVEFATRTSPYTYDEFAPNVWKSGNLLGHYGVHPGADVTVVAGPKEATPTETTRRIDAADSLFATLGATAVGATVSFDPVEPVESRALVAPAGWIDRYETAPRCTRIAYGGPPDAPEIVHFETEMWSENPIEPPERIDAEDPALVDEDGSYTHRELLTAAEAFVEAHGLDAESRVGFDAPVVEPGAVVPLLAALSVGGTLAVGGEGADADVSVFDGADGREEEASTTGGVTVETLTQHLRDTRRA